MMGTFTKLLTVFKLFHAWLYCQFDSVLHFSAWVILIELLEVLTNLVYGSTQLSSRNDSLYVMYKAID